MRRAKLETFRIREEEVDRTGDAFANICEMLSRRSRRLRRENYDYKYLHSLSKMDVRLKIKVSVSYVGRNWFPRS